VSKPNKQIICSLN